MGVPGFDIGSSFVVMNAMRRAGKHKGSKFPDDPNWFVDFVVAMLFCVLAIACFIVIKFC